MAVKGVLGTLVDAAPHQHQQAKPARKIRTGIEHIAKIPAVQDVKDVTGALA